MKNIMNVIEEDWYALYILGLSTIVALIKWAIRKWGW